MVWTNSESLWLRLIYRPAFKLQSGKNEEKRNLVTTAPLLTGNF